MVLWLNVCDKEHLALRNNFRMTKKFLITKFDCIKTPVIIQNKVVLPVLAPPEPELT